MTKDYDLLLRGRSRRNDRRSICFQGRNENCPSEAELPEESF